MNRLLLTWILMAVTSHLSSSVILRPKWFPYFTRHNQGGSGRVASGSGGSAHAYHQNGRPAGTMTSRHARTVDIVDMEPNGFAASQHVPAYPHNSIRSSTNAGNTRTSSRSIGSGRDYNSYNYFEPERDSRSIFARSSSGVSSRTGNNNIPRCRSGQRSEECLTRTVMLLGKMLEMERDRRATDTDGFYD